MKVSSGQPRAVQCGSQNQDAHLRLYWQDKVLAKYSVVDFTTDIDATWPFEPASTEQVELFRCTKIGRLIISQYFSTYAPDRRAVPVCCLAGMPSPTGCTAAQRLHCQLQFVAGLERLTRPAVPSQAVRAVSFQIPDDRPRVTVHDLQRNEDVWAGKPEIPNDADQLNWVLPIEHRNGVMAVRRAARCDKPDAHNEGAGIDSHRTTPSGLASEWEPAGRVHFWLRRYTNRPDA